jgi:hypothetical protein
MINEEKNHMFVIRLLVSDEDFEYEEMNSFVF